METNILMESGTNEVEILEFMVGNNHYGINVAKIKEIVTYQKITPVPVAKPEVEGIFMPRDTMITVIDLARVLNLPASDNINSDMFIITNFNKLNVAFHVASVVGIHRVSWTDIIKPDSTISSADSGIATGVVKINGQLIIILDFERIVSDISPETGLKVSDIEKLDNFFSFDDELKTSIKSCEAYFTPTAIIFTTVKCYYGSGKLTVTEDYYNKLLNKYDDLKLMSGFPSRNYLGYFEENIADRADNDFLTFIRNEEYYYSENLSDSEGMLILLSQEKGEIYFFINNF